MHIPTYIINLYYILLIQLKLTDSIVICIMTGSLIRSNLISMYSNQRNNFVAHKLNECEKKEELNQISYFNNYTCV